MACPYFYPVQRRASDTSLRSALLPLGDAWTGLCQASPAAAWEPEDALLQTQCALGYARGVCPRFPADDTGPDAVRFSIEGDDGASLRLYYVLERDHLPFAHGPLEYSLHSGRFACALAPGIFSRQAEAYIQSYLRRKNEASGP
jgi:hypothetical protein